MHCRKELTHNYRQRPQIQLKIIIFTVCVCVCALKKTEKIIFIFFSVIVAVFLYMKYVAVWLCVRVLEDTSYCRHLQNYTQQNWGNNTELSDGTLIYYFIFFFWDCASRHFFRFVSVSKIIEFTNFCLLLLLSHVFIFVSIQFWCSCLIFFFIFQYFYKLDTTCFFLFIYEYKCSQRFQGLTELCAWL